MALLRRPDGCRLWFETHGDPSTPPLVLLEGLGGDIPGWRRNIPVLATACWVVAFDHRGNGRSDDPPGPCTMATFVEDACAVLDEVRIIAAHVYGQSFGGMVAIELALTRPERIRTLILAATHAGPSREVRTGGANVSKGEPWRALYALGFPETHPTHVADDLAVGAAGVQHTSGERRQWEAIQGFDAYDRLGGIEVPTLVLHGTEDQLVAPENAVRLAGDIPGAELRLLEGAGHLYHSEQAVEADAAVLDFIARDP